MYEDFQGFAKAATIFAKAVTIFAVSALVLLIITSTVYFVDRRETVKKIASNLEEITFYLDGVEVDYETINLGSYSIIYDEEKQIVKLTKPILRRSTPTVVPVIPHIH